MVRDLSQHLSLCSINTATLGFQAPIGEVVDAVARAGFGMVAPWRREVEGGYVKAIARHMRDAGLKLSGYCRSTYMPANDAVSFRANVDANKRALDDAAEMGSPCFVMVVGGLPAGSKDMAAARQQVKDATAELLEYGRTTGVRIALEPLHPVYAADRSCLTLLSEALDWCDAIESKSDDPWLGVAIDAYHMWWDPGLTGNLTRAAQARRILAYHVCDWLVPTNDVLNDRGMMGDGVIDLQSMRRTLETHGYTGPVEVEIFSAANWWKRPIQDTLEVCRERLVSAT